LTDRPALTVVVGTREGWRYVQNLVERLTDDATGLDVEIILVDGSGREAPRPPDIDARVRWLVADDGSVFRLFARGLREARGEVIATTEDHALPWPGWCSAILRAHVEHPEAAAIGGTIENGSTDRLLDWASYFITQGPHMGPLGNRVVAVTTNEADLSFKRRAIEDFDDNAGMGFMAILHTKRLAQSGEVLRVDDRMKVDHFQSIGLRETSAIHFHNGRSISGFRRSRGMKGADWVRLVVAPVLPLWRTVRLLRVAWAKGGQRARLVASLPLCVYLEYCQAAGHFMGYVAGAGDSPNQLR
jgi:hypothetical protein